MTTTQLKERIACVLVKSRAPLYELAEACYRFSPQIAVRPQEPPGILGDRTMGGAIFLEIGRCRNLYSEDSLLMRLGLLTQRFGALARVGFGNAVPEALAMARYGSTKLEKLPLEALHDYASPFHYNEDCFHKTAKLIDTMRLLGLSSIEDFMKLPTKSLASRFAAEGVELSLRLQGKSQLAWPRFTPPEQISEKAELHDLSEFQSCRELEPLLFIVKNLADRAMARLRGRAQRMASLEVVLDLERGKREWSLDLPVPQGSAAGLLPILRERLSFDLQRAPLDHAIVRVEITVTETAPAYRAQRDLFQAGETESEAWDALVGRLCQKLGKDRAFIAKPVDNYLPERAWARALEALDKLPADIPPRPVRMLRKPQPIKQEGHFLVQTPSKRWRITEWQGPERIAVEWWMDPQLEGFKRDYYQVETEAGEKLWIFSVPSKPGYYLHGFFD